MPAAYASEKKVLRLEQEINNLRSAFEAQTEMIVEMRERLLPTPINIMYDRMQSPADTGSGICTQTPCPRKSASSW